MNEDEYKVDHDRHHPNGKDAHYCPEWDYLYICRECPEFEACSCFPEANKETERNVSDERDN